MSDMMNPEDFGDLEQALRTLRPSGGGVDSDRVIYEAGRADGRRSIHRWRAAGGVLAVALAASLLMRSPLNTPQIAQVPQQPGANLPPVPREAQTLQVAPAMPRDMPSVTSLDVDAMQRYYALRRRVLDAVPQELAALDSTPRTASTHTSAGDLSDIERLLEPPPSPRERPLPWWVRLAAGDPS